MVILFDTSILISACVTSHPKHKLGLAWLSRATKKEFDYVVSAHSIAECYSVLTRLPLSPKITPAMAKLLIEENIEKTAKLIFLNSNEYIKLIKEVADLGLTGGIIYDAITVKAAQKAKAKKILTFNVRDFQRLVPKDPDLIISP